MIIRRNFIKKILNNRRNNLRVISGIGTSTWDLMSTGDDRRNFGFIGAMGQALPFALGLSISQQDKRILLITGDGDTLMSLGCLATIANHPMKNLVIFVLDNESYVETGKQPTATAGKTNLEMIAKGAGIDNSYTINERNEDYKVMNTLYNEDGPSLVIVKCKAEATPLIFPHSFDGVTALNRFMDTFNGDSKNV